MISEMFRNLSYYRTRFVVPVAQKECAPGCHVIFELTKARDAVVRERSDRLEVLHKVPERPPFGYVRWIAPLAGRAHSLHATPEREALEKREGVVDRQRLTGNSATPIPIALRRADYVSVALRLDTVWRPHRWLYSVSARDPLVGDADAAKHRRWKRAPLCALSKDRRCEQPESVPELKFV